MVFFPSLMKIWTKFLSGKSFESMWKKMNIWLRFNNGEKNWNRKSSSLSLTKHTHTHKTHRKNPNDLFYRIFFCFNFLFFTIFCFVFTQHKKKKSHQNFTSQKKPPLFLMNAHILINFFFCCFFYVCFVYFVQCSHHGKKWRKWKS